jgi:hypothetical protein
MFSHLRFTLCLDDSVDSSYLAQTEFRGPHLTVSISVEIGLFCQLLNARSCTSRN